MNFENIKKLAFWSSLLGWIMLISGVINAIIGLFAFIIGAIPGAITAFLGYKLIKASQQAKRLYEEGPSENCFNEFLIHFYQFFKIQGIVFIIGLVLAVLFFLFVINTIITIGSFDFWDLFDHSDYLLEKKGLNKLLI